MTYKTVNVNTSSYLSDLHKPYIYPMISALRIEGSYLSPALKKESAGFRGLSSHASLLWNNLPADIRQSDSAEVLKF